MLSRRRRLLALATGGALIFAPLVLATAPSAHATMNYNHLTKIQKRIVSGALASALGPAPSVNPSANAAPGGGDEQSGTGDEAQGPDPKSYAPATSDNGVTGNYQPTSASGCSQNIGSNVKVNQNCQNLTDADLQGRGQAQNETSIAQDPSEPTHLIASQNDYRRGDGNCYGAYSLDNGRTWTDTTIPMGFTRGAAFGAKPRQYWEAGGDTSVAFDTKGNGYFSCQVFNRGLGVTNNPDQSSAFYVFRSTGNSGASWNFPGRPVAQRFDLTGASLLDKQLLTVDNHPGSPFQDRVYVSWTDFTPDGTAYIYESHSDDYGETFSPPVLVSGDSALCTNTFGAATPHGRCNENQFSQPFTGKDGALYVAFNNFNNQPTAGTDNRYQVLLAKSTDGGQSFHAPVKVSDYYDLPDCDTYQGAGSDPGRACVPEKAATSHSVFRATNYASGSVDPTNPNRVVVSFGSYINRFSNESNGCVPAGFASDGNPTYTGVKTPGACNNDVLVGISTNGGASFATSSDPRHGFSVTTQPGQRTTDQFWQWADFTPTGRLAVSYMDRQYGDDEQTGYSDFSLSGGFSAGGFATTRVTSSSMPPPTQFAGQFYGDYTGLSAMNQAHPYWPDTRNAELFLCPGTGTPGNPPATCTGTEPNGLQANEEEVFTDTVAVP